MNELAGELLSAYAQVFFARGREAGMLVAAATFTSPRLGACGAAGVLTAAALRRLLRFEAARAARGRWGVNALLAGLAVGAFVTPAATVTGSAQLLALVALGAAAALLVDAAMESTRAALLGLPVLTVPFVLAGWVVVLAAPHFGQVGASPLGLPVRSLLPAPLALYLQSLGAMFFVPTALAGALVLASLLLWSRIAALLSLLGFAVAQATLLLSGAQPDSPSLSLLCGYNGAATAIALGGIWFVPQRSSFVLAALATPLTTLLALALQGPLASLGLPLLILPFNLVMAAVLPALRQRTRDGSPKAVDFDPGTPEANLNYYRTRLARFGERSAVRFRLPLSGRWTVTQGFDGPHTHRAEWRHALDFEATSDDGAAFEGAGTSLRDYYSYRLPVLCAAAGTVVRVQDHVPDNPPGERNASNPWGNHVIVQHGPALFSLVAHLSPGSIEVTVGQVVAAGARLGLCGNSGRSFVPHVHFHVQSGPRPGAPTVEFELSDLIVDDEQGSTLRRVHQPRLGELVRAIEPRDEIAALFRLPVGGRWTFAVEGDGTPARRETVTADIDLANHTFLESDTGGRLYFERQPHQLVVYDHVGEADSVLRWLFTALPRVPFERPGAIGWDDVLPARSFRRGAARWLLDFVDPFLPTTGQRLAFHAERQGSDLVVGGRGQRGSQAIETRVQLTPADGIREIEVRLGDTVRRARLVPEGGGVPAARREAA